MDAPVDADKLRASGALLATEIALSDAIEREAVAGTPYDSTTLDLLIRLALAPDHQLRAVELCRQLLLSASHVSRRLDRAEAEGLVERRPDPDDRRASQVVLTAAGRDAVADFGPRLEAVLDRTILGVLDRDEIETLVDLLERIEAAARGARP